MTSTGRPAAAWYPDPTGRHQHRYWDGERWTTNVADDGVTAFDGPAQQPTVQQPAAQLPAVQQPVVQPVVQQPAVNETVIPEQPTASGWSPVPERPAPTPQYSWQPTSPSAAFQAEAAAVHPVRPSKGRGWIFALAFVVAVAGIGATAMLALGRSDDSATTASGDHDYPAVVEANFMTACTSTGGNESFCRCALDHIEQAYDFADFAEAERSYLASGKLPDSMMNAARDCAPQLYGQ